MTNRLVINYVWHTTYRKEKASDTATRIWNRVSQRELSKREFPGNK